MSINNIRTSGGIFTHHFVESLQQDSLNHPAMNVQVFVLPGKDKFSEKELESKISTAWEALVERWDAVEREFGALEISALRQRWLRPLFYYLNIEPEFQRGDTVLEGDMRFPISHMGRVGTTEFTLPIHTVLYNVENALDSRVKAGRGMKKVAPHDMVQRYLNLSKEHDWALITDGVYLRLLRDFHHTYTRGFVEFDLQGIFNSRDFAGFRAMYRLLHASRFVIDEEKQAAPIDALYEDALAMGVKVGEDLRKNVQAAIESLANGFLVSSPGFIEQVAQQADGVAQLYRDILMTIYRMLFLLFAEQRGMLPGRGSLYMEEFSLTAFRTLAELPPSENRNLDLWEKIKTTFSMVEHGVDELGIYAYNGALFSLNRTPRLTPDDSASAPRCRNDYFLQTVRHLTTVEKDRVLQRISYSDLSVEEIGSIYESLLEFTPRISENQIEIEGRQIPANTFFLDPRGLGRKTSGSYYTPPSLVNELIKSALVPVMENRIKSVVPGYDPELVEALTEEERQAAEEAILALNVVDPAAGSGAFLIAANNKLALELACIRSGEYFPPQDVIQHARRDVLAHCIYAVDLNPMAVELCKVSLWINAAVEDAPLNFLDHHIRWGNSLVGASPKLIKEGIPNDAYKPVTGDNKDVAKAIKAQNRAELKGQMGLMRVTTLKTQADVQQWSEIAQLAEDDPNQAEAEYYAYYGSADYWDRRLPYDLWTAAFFSPLIKDQPVPTSQDVQQAQANRKIFNADLKANVYRIAERYRFFHWHLEFPEIFDEEDGNGGFDVVLGNPPWERVKLQEKEFFDGKDDQITNAPNAAARKRLIAKLPHINQNLWKEFQHALRNSECTSKFLRDSGAYPLTGRGDVNTYQVFAGKDRDLIWQNGRAGFIVPTGIATDYTNKYFFADLVETGQLASLYDFENRKGLFPGVHRMYKFCLLTLRGIFRSTSEPTEFAFFLQYPEDLQNEETRFHLTAADFNLLNPNTKTCPIFRSRTDANLTRKIYKFAPVLVNEMTEENPWGVSFSAMFHMANDSHLFCTRNQLEEKGFILKGSTFIKDDEIWVPLYEAKMFWHYDHRFGTFEGIDSRSNTSISAIASRESDCLTLPWYWVSAKETISRVPDSKWLISFRDITNVSNERTAVFTFLPFSGVGHTAPLIFSRFPLNPLFLVASINSFIFDYSTRQKVGGTHLTYSYLKQLPVLGPDIFSRSISNVFLPKLFELIYTSWDLASFADELWNKSDMDLKKNILKQHEQNIRETNSTRIKLEEPSWIKYIRSSNSPSENYPRPPFVWDEIRRFRIRCELEALFGHLYNLTRNEVEYILETFPIFKRRDIERHGEFRTKQVILEEFEKLKDDPILEGVCVPLNKRVSSFENPYILQPVSPTPPVFDKPANKITPPIRKPKPKTAKPTKKFKVPENQTQLFGGDTDYSAERSDYGLYRCTKCGKSVMGFSIEEHTQEVHQGNDPGYQKIN